MIEYQVLGTHWSVIDPYYDYNLLEKKVKAMETRMKIVTFRIGGKLYKEFNDEFKYAFEAEKFWEKLNVS